jgi:N-acetylglutamate synthase-like GNAT family acetyltransferase
MKRIRTLTIKQLVKEKPSKPKVKLSKADPDFFKKLGSVSAEKRNLPASTFSEMAAASHPRRRKNEPAL